MRQKYAIFIAASGRQRSSRCGRVCWPIRFETCRTRSMYSIRMSRRFSCMVLSGTVYPGNLDHDSGVRAVARKPLDVGLASSGFASLLAISPSIPNKRIAYSHKLSAPGGPSPMWQFETPPVPADPHRPPRPEGARALGPRSEISRRRPTRASIRWSARAAAAPSSRTWTAISFSTSPPASPSTATGHCHPQGRRRDSGPGGQADSHVGHRFLLSAADRPGPAAGRVGAGHDAEARLLHQQRGRGARSGAQAGALAHATARGPSLSSAPFMAELMGPCRCRARSWCIGAAFRRWCRTFITCRFRAAARGA